MLLSLPLAVSALLAAPAVPQVPPSPREVRVALQWQAPPQCPSRDEVAGHISRFSDAVLTAPGDASVQIDGVVTPTGRGYAVVVTVATATESSQRQLEADDCVLLGRAVGLVVAVALDPLVVAARVSTEAEASATPKPAPEPEPTLLAEPVPPPRGPAPEPAQPQPPRPPSADGPPRAAGSRVEVGGRLGLGVGGLILPGAGLGLLAAPFVGGRRFVGELALQYWVPRGEELSGTVDAGASFQLATAGLRACPVLAFDRWRVLPCAGIDGGAVIGAGRGTSLAANERVASAWAAAIVQVGAEVTLTPRLGLFAAFEGAIALTRPEFHLDLPSGAATLHQAGRFGPRGLLGIVVHTPRLAP